MAKKKEEDVVIKINNIKKAFHHQEILKGINLTVNKGDVMVLLGPSGSGKTTFLRCLNYLEQADEGELEIGDLAVDFKTIKKKEINELRKKTAFVFQNYNLFKNKTAIENITEGLIVGRKMSKNEARKIALQVLEKVNLADKADYYPVQLSGGQQQRVGIARAIAVDAEVILFDEPTSALDPELVGEVLSIIKKLAEEGKTMIIVTHEIHFAKNVANHIIFFDEGRIVEEGPPEIFFSSQKEERTRQFLCQILPEMNYVI